MSKPATVNVLYPRKDGSTFDLKYYLDTHMPMVYKHWNSHGLKSFKVTQYGEGPYTMNCSMEWDSVDAFKTAGTLACATEIFGDISNFSTEQPVIIGGEVVGTS
ncbi:hypothetical protein DM02DRAFT_608307 [Periconia macrospinosa]|uniref:EthD domain-containing protein n=1 Tax=Periconia macrospinosa TaxID=97972 RepID=A0A2V1EFI5_9PLEO|nr:hypothetical protein DM02DRAFT_608307 [Periconia macrospinosa]